MSNLGRREFIASVAAMTGYSLLVDARGMEPDQIASPMSHDQRRDAIKQFQHNVSSQGKMAAEPHMQVVKITTDVLVVGGGMAGVCAAISAARHGAKVLLVQDRSRLGGNASSEIKMHIVGADVHGSRAGWREGGLIEEFRIEDAVYNSHRAWELFDLMLYDKCVSEPNLTLLLDTTLYHASVHQNKITEVLARCDKTETIYQIQAQTYCDCTGDSRLALEAGAAFRAGREAKSEFNEPLAQNEPDKLTQGSSILFTARKHDHPIPYKCPGWARKITKKQLRFRPIPKRAYEYGYWWIELGGKYDTIKDNEQLRFELLSIVLGVWDWIKNSGERPDAASWALETVGMIPGKRESRRIVGDHVQTEGDLRGGWKNRDDGVAIGGWGFDDHPPGGFDASDKGPYSSAPIAEPYNIAFESLYSRTISNLMMAGRNISNTHVAFTSTRVMATCACIGQAVGTAVALCKQYNLLPRQLRTQRMKQFQQILIRDDQTIRGTFNVDPEDLAGKAKIVASAQYKNTKPENVINGIVRDMPGDWFNRWAALMDKDGPWIEFQWDKPQTISHVQLTFDTGFYRELTLSASDGVTRRMRRSAQLETVRDYTLTGKTSEGKTVTLVEVKGNYQRLRRHDFDATKIVKLRLQVHATNGSKEARVFEIRCYK